MKQPRRDLAVDCFLDAPSLVFQRKFTPLRMICNLNKSLVVGGSIKGSVLSRKVLCDLEKVINFSVPQFSNLVNEDHSNT